MQRREFLGASVAAAASVAAGASAPAQGDAPSGRQLIELRTYHFSSPEKLQAYERFFADAAAPALTRAGVRPVGAFKLLAKDNASLKLAADANDLFVLLPHPNAESFVTLESRLAADETYQSAGRSILTAGQKDPAYARYESSVMLAFEGFPQVQAPAKSESRLVQLRIYESHNEERARRKVHMFNQGGEIGIFKSVGMTPVFFGQTLAGSKLPNLTYMLAFEDEAAQTKAWNGFRGNEAWKKLSADESYKEAVSNITNLVLRPAAGSQI